MKIIQAMKQVKDLTRKAGDLVELAQKHCADLDCETPMYPDQRTKVAEWIQGHSDILKEISRLKYRITKTNLNTPVTITIGDAHVTKSIAEWIHRRKDLADMELRMWRSLTDKGLKETYQNQMTPNSPAIHVKRRLYFDPAQRDSKINALRSEPSLIDATLETINAVTDLME